MNGMTVILPYRGQPWFEKVRQALLRSPLVRKIFVVQQGGFKSTQSMVQIF